MLNQLKETDIHKSAKQGNLELLEALVLKGIDVNSPNENGETPLHLSIHHNGARIIRKLAELGADIDSKDKYGNTPLHLAANRGYFDVVKELIHAGSNVRERNNSGDTPLDLVTFSTNILSEHTREEITYFLNITLLNVPSGKLEGQVLTGNSKQQWHVKKMIAKSQDATGSQFSIGYTVQDSNGNEYFLKATDHNLYYRNDEFSLKIIGKVTNDFNFEVDILKLCEDKKLDRIVRAHDFGSFEMKHDDYKAIVYFLIFEKAESDIRVETRKRRQVGYAWIPKFVHNFSVAVSQLHINKISHNDLKPSNVLYFDSTIQKLADLGRATCEKHISQFDNKIRIGAIAYLAPEEWEFVNYKIQNFGRTIPLDYRKLCDLYMLGGLIYFIITGTSFNLAIKSEIPRDILNNNQKTNFSDILPVIENAHVITMKKLEVYFKYKFGDEAFSKLGIIFKYIKYLTAPNPDLRGDPTNKTFGLQQYDLQRLITYSDLLIKTLGKEK